MSRSLMAANPLTEKNDASVKWYEKLLMWEQGKLEEAPSPDFEEGGNPLALLEAMALAEDQDVRMKRPDWHAGVEALGASGEITQPESASSTLLDEDGRPLRSGPPTHQDYYGNDAPASQENQRHATPYLLNGDHPSRSASLHLVGEEAHGLLWGYVIKRHLDGPFQRHT